MVEKCPSYFASTPDTSGSAFEGPVPSYLQLLGGEAPLPLGFNQTAAAGALIPSSAFGYQPLRLPHVGELP